MPDYSTFDLGEVIQEACEQAGVLLRGPAQYQSARRSLSLVLLDWENRGLMLWRVREAAFPCSVGVHEYTAANGLPLDYIDFLDASVRVTAGGQITDFPLERMGFSQWESLARKDMPGRPSRMYSVRGITPAVRLWMVPDRIGMMIRLWYLAEIAQPSMAGRHAADPQNTLHVLRRFVPALCAGVAYEMSRKSLSEAVLQRVTALKSEYEGLLMRAMDADSDRSSFYARPQVYS